MSATDRALIAAMLYTFARVSALVKLESGDYYHNGANRPVSPREKGGKEHEMPMHHMLEEMLNEYIVAAGLQRGQRLFESVNAPGTAVTVELLTPTTPGLRFGSGPRQRAFSPPLDVTPGGDRHQRFTWRTTAGPGHTFEKSSTVNAVVIRVCFDEV